MEEQPVLYFGFPEEQKHFEENYQPLAKGLESIKEACDTAISHAPTATLPDKVLNFLAWQIFEDFSEIFLLCANGQNNGARKILRGMFERIVYFLYLEKHRDQAELYMNYFWIDRYNKARRMEKFQPDLMTAEEREELNKQYENYKQDYQVPVCRACKDENCKECKKKRMNHSWTKVDMPTMATEVGIPPQLLESGYYIPMEETHPKIGAFLRRLKLDDEQKMMFDSSPVPGDEIEPLCVAHYLLLQTLDKVKTIYNIEALEEPLKRCLADFQQTWKGKDINQV
jgi:hypothetical protein